MTSLSVLRQGALQAIFHDVFWKTDHDFLIVIHSNFLSGMHGFRDNEVLLQARYDVIASPPPGGAALVISMTKGTKPTPAMMSEYLAIWLSSAADAADPASVLLS